MAAMVIEYLIDWKICNFCKSFNGLYAFSLHRICRL